MSTLRDKIGEIIGQYIPEGEWDKTFKELNPLGQGLGDPKVIQQTVLELCKRIEKLENELSK